MKKNKKDKKNPALSIKNFHKFATSVFNQINYVRTHPEEYIVKLKDLLESLSTAKEPNCLVIQNVPFLYKDLKKSLTETIKFLSTQKSLEEFKFNKEITKGCNYLLDSLIINDGANEAFASNYSLGVRLNLYGLPIGDIFELIDYGMFDPEFIVLNFILGDGDNSKYERNVIFNPKLKQVGIASGLLPSDRICTILNFVETFYKKGDKIPIEDKKRSEKNIARYNTKTINNYSTKVGQEYQMGKVLPNEDKPKESAQEDKKKTESFQTFEQKKAVYSDNRNRASSIFDLNEYGGISGIIGSAAEKEKNAKDNGIKQPNKNEQNLANDQEDFDMLGINPKIPFRRKRTVHEPDDFVDDVQKEQDVKEFDITNKANNKDNSNKNNINQDIINRAQSSKVTSFLKLIEDDDLVFDNDYPNPNPKTTSVTKVVRCGKGYKKITTTIVEEYYEDKIQEDNSKNLDNKDKISPSQISEKTTEGKKADEAKVDIQPTSKIEANIVPDKAKSSKSNINETNNPEITRQESKKEEPSQLKKIVVDKKNNYMLEEDSIEWPKNSIGMKVRQKVYTNSNGEKILQLKKTVTYNNGKTEILTEQFAIAEQ